MSTSLITIGDAMGHLERARAVVGLVNDGAAVRSTPARNQVTAGSSSATTTRLPSSGVSASERVSPGAAHPAGSLPTMGRSAGRPRAPSSRTALVPPVLIDDHSRHAGDRSPHCREDIAAVTQRNGSRLPLHQRFGEPALDLFDDARGELIDRHFTDRHVGRERSPRETRVRYTPCADSAGDTGFPMTRRAPSAIHLAPSSGEDQVPTTKRGICSVSGSLWSRSISSFTRKIGVDDCHVGSQRTRQVEPQEGRSVRSHSRSPSAVWSIEWVIASAKPTGPTTSTVGGTELVLPMETWTGALAQCASCAGSFQRPQRIEGARDRRYVTGIEPPYRSCTLE